MLKKETLGMAAALLWGLTVGAALHSFFKGAAVFFLFIVAFMVSFFWYRAKPTKTLKEEQTLRVKKWLAANPDVAADLLKGDVKKEDDKVD